MSDALLDSLLLILCLGGLILSWLDRWIEGECDKAAERQRRNFGRSNN